MSWLIHNLIGERLWRGVWALIPISLHSFNFNGMNPFYFWMMTILFLLRRNIKAFGVNLQKMLATPWPTGFSLMIPTNLSHEAMSVPLSRLQQRLENQTSLPLNFRAFFHYGPEGSVPHNKLAHCDSQDDASSVDSASLEPDKADTQESVLSSLMT